MFADETSLGWDPTIVRVPLNEYDPKLGWQYDITVHERLNDNPDGPIQEVVYRTEKLISHVAADGIYGRGTRVWTARLKTTDSKESPLVVIKDYWVDPNRQREGAINRCLRKEVAAKDKEMEKHLHKHLPTVLAHGDVLIANSRDTTRSLLKGDGPIVSIDLVSGLTPSREPTIKTPSSPLSRTSYVDRFPREIVHLDPKTHYRIVFKEVGHALHEEGSLAAAFRAIQGAMVCKLTFLRDGMICINIAV